MSQDFLGSLDLRLWKSCVVGHPEKIWDVLRCPRTSFGPGTLVVMSGRTSWDVPSCLGLLGIFAWDFGSHVL